MPNFADLWRYVFRGEEWWTDEIAVVSADESPDLDSLGHHPFGKGLTTDEASAPLRLGHGVGSCIYRFHNGKPPHKEERLCVGWCPLPVDEAPPRGAL